MPLSIAVPASFVARGQCRSVQQATSAVAAISRAAIYFGVGEIVIYEDRFETSKKSGGSGQKKQFLDEIPGSSTVGNAQGSKPQPSWEAWFVAQALRYLVTPPYLRRTLFTDEKDNRALRYAAKLPPAPAPHLAPSKSSSSSSLHGVPGLAVRRAGTRKGKGEKKSKRERAHERTTPYINIGQSKLLELAEEVVPVGQRVLVDVKTRTVLDKSGTGIYAVRIASRVSEIYTDAPGGDGYSYTAYVPCGSTFAAIEPTGAAPASWDQIKTQESALLLFGRWQDVKEAVAADAELQVPAADLLDGFVSGFERMRVEDAAMCALAAAGR